MEHASEAELRSEAQTANLLLVFALGLVVLAAIAFLLWGLPALTMIGLVETVAVFGMLIAYATGL
ncbi:MAG: hypothetical protein U1E41_07220 [Paracoccus sp. (in: a-proteobacteria)]|jgi:hypothetical protein